MTEDTFLATATIEDLIQQHTAALEMLRRIFRGGAISEAEYTACAAVHTFALDAIYEKQKGQAN